MHHDPHGEGLTRYLDIARKAARRYKTAAIIFGAGALATLGYVGSRPDVYKSEARIAVETNLFDPLRRGVSDANNKDKAESLYNRVEAAIFTRSVLEPIITDLGLYEDLSKRKPMSVLVERLRSDAGLDTTGDKAIRLSYQSDDPAVAQEVVARLAKAFLAAEDASARAVLDAARAFGKERLAEADEEVKKAEDTLKKFSDDNADIMPTLLTRGSTDPLGIGRNIGPLATADLATLLSYREKLRQQMDDLAAGRSLEPSTREIKLQAELDARRRELAELELQFTAEHPVTVTQKGRVSILEQELQTVAPKLSAEETKALSSVLDKELKAVDDEIGARTKTGVAKAEALKSAKRIAEASIAYDTLTRALERARADRDALARMSSDARIMGEIAAAQAASRYRLVDPPELASIPVWPNRTKMTALGVIASLAAAVLFTIVLALLDDRVYRASDIRSAVEAPVLTVVPNLRRGA